MKKVWINRSINAAMLLVLSVNFAACIPGGGGGKGGGSSATSGSAGPVAVANSSDTPTNLIAQQVTNVGVKNFDQINETFSVLTGVPPSEVAGVTQINGQNQDGFDALKAALPLSNDLRTFSGPTQVAILKLAGRYCYRAIRDNPNSIQGGGLRTRQQVLPPNLMVGGATIAVNNLNQNPSQLFTPENNVKIASYFIQNFWKRDPAAQPNTDDAMYVQLITELATGEAATATSSLNVLVGVCSAVLANSNVFLL